MNIEKLRIPDKKQALSSLHLSACSLSKNFDDPQHLLQCTMHNFGVIAIIETRINRNVSLTSNLSLKYYSIEFPTESSAVGTKPKVV